MKIQRGDIILLLICLCVIGAWASGFFIRQGISTGSIEGEVTGKHEANNRFYIDLRIEIPANDYIGLDIGDEYEIGGNK